MLQSGVNLIYIRDFLGHSDITTTQIYARVDTETRRRALEATRIPGMIPEGPSWTEDAELLQWLPQLRRPTKPESPRYGELPGDRFRHHRRNRSHLHITWRSILDGVPRAGTRRKVDAVEASPVSSANCCRPTSKPFKRDPLLPPPLAVIRISVALKYTRFMRALVRGPLHNRPPHELPCWTVPVGNRAS